MFDAHSGLSIITPADGGCGELLIGSLVAIIAAGKDLVPPWKELLDDGQLYRSSEAKSLQILAEIGQTPELLDAPSTDKSERQSLG